MQVETIDYFQNYKFTLLEGITKGQTILSFESSYGSRPFNIDDENITILLSPKTDLNLGDTVVIHCEKGFTGSVSSSTSPGVYNSLAIEETGEIENKRRDMIIIRPMLEGMCVVDMDIK